MVDEGKNEEVSKASVTELLQSFPSRQEELYEMVYNQLREMARARMAHENRENTLQPTALVNEAYLKLANQKCEWKDRRHFYGVAAQAMKRILIDTARSRNREKRGGDMVRQPILEVDILGSELDSDILELNDALDELAELSPEQAEIVQLKFFSGLTLIECGKVLEISQSMVERRWRFARAWLRTKIEEKE